MAITYDALATTTVGAAAAITFSSISGAYTDLLLVVQGGATAGTNLLELRFNSDSSAIYDYVGCYGNGTSLVSTSSSNNNVAYNTASSGSVTNGLTYITIPSYAQTTSNKLYVSRTVNVSAGNFTGGIVTGEWRSTAAITSIVIYGQSLGTLITGTMATLYGVKRA